MEDAENDPKSMRELLRRGKEAWGSLKAGETWDKWKTIGFAIDAISRDAMLDAGTNDRIGKGYNIAYRAAMDEHPWIDEIDKSVRSKLQSCIDNLTEIEAWRADHLTLNQRVMWNHPNTILTKWKASKKPPKDPSDRTTDPKDEVIEKLTNELKGAQDTIIEQESELETVTEAVNNLRRDREADEAWAKAGGEVTELRQKAEQAEKDAEVARGIVAETTQQAEVARDTARKARLEVQEKETELDALRARCKALEQERDEWRQRAEALGFNSESDNPKKNPSEIVEGKPVCPECGKAVALTKAGLFRSHNTVLAGQNVQCIGSGKDAGDDGVVPPVTPESIEIDDAAN